MAETSASFPAPLRLLKYTSAFQPKPNLSQVGDAIELHLFRRYRLGTLLEHVPPATSDAFRPPTPTSASRPSPYCSPNSSAVLRELRAALRESNSDTDIPLNVLHSHVCHVYEAVDLDKHEGVEWLTEWVEMAVAWPGLAY